MTRLVAVACIAFLLIAVVASFLVQENRQPDRVEWSFPRESWESRNATAYVEGFKWSGAPAVVSSATVLVETRASMDGQRMLSLSFEVTYEFDAEDNVVGVEVTKLEEFAADGFSTASFVDLEQAMAWWTIGVTTVPTTGRHAYSPPTGRSAVGPLEMSCPRITFGMSTVFAEADWKNRNGHYPQVRDVTARRVESGEQPIDWTLHVKAQDESADEQSFDIRAGSNK